jgi:2TM domain
VTVDVYHKLIMLRSWPRPPDRKDLEYRKVDDRMNFAVHVLAFSASNSTLWFVKILLQADWDWPIKFTAAWAIVVFLHALYVFVIADYSEKSNG